MTIRPVQHDELAKLHAFALNTFVTAFGHQNAPENMAIYLNEHLTLDSIRQEMSNSNSRFFFAEADRQIIAYLKLNQGEAQSEQQLENALEIERIYVHTSQQGKGIGQQLLAFALELAVKENFAHLWLGVWDQNRDAIRFYERHGYGVFSQHDFYLGHDLQTDIMLKYSI